MASNPKAEQLASKGNGNIVNVRWGDVEDATLLSHC